MNIELTKKLFAAHPRLLGHLEQTSQGIEHADGWFDILDRLFFDIQDYINQRNLLIENQIRLNHAITQAINGHEFELRNYYSKVDVTDELSLEEYTLAAICHRGVVDNLVEDHIKQGILRNISDAIEQVVVVQVKEKFGSLRVYYDGGDATVDRMIEAAALMAETTCELCGIDGTLQNVNGWQRVVCVNHQAVLA